MMNPHSQDVRTVLKALKSSKRGLSSVEVEKRFGEYGPNELEEFGRPTVLAIFFRQFKSLMVYILLMAALISASVGEVADAVMILVIVLFNAFFGAWQEYRAEKAIEALKGMAAPHATVIRDGKEQVIPARGLVPGDVIILSVGERVPADCRTLEEINLYADESALTGESLPKSKSVEPSAEGAAIHEQLCMAFMNTLVVRGRGKAIVTSTGMSTEIGKVARLVQAVEDEETPMQIRLREISKKLGFIIVVIIAALFALELVSSPSVLAAPDFWQTPEFISLFLVAVSLAVSAIPEGLPAVVTITLALGVQRMAKRNAVVRKLSSVETLGSTTVICSDKTGTLTENRMTVIKLFLDGRELPSSGGTSLMYEAFVSCNDAVLSEAGVIGDPTEGALLMAAKKAGIFPHYERVDEVPFDSKRKMMSVLVRTPEGLRVFTKGAPEVVLERCSRVLEDGVVKRLTKAGKDALLEKNSGFASQALRVLAVAYKDAGGHALKEDDLVLVGLVGMRDPARLEVREAIQKCFEAGIDVKVVTGDNPLTARAVAEEVGLFSEGDELLVGSDVDAMNDQQLRHALRSVRIFARVSPEHKHRIVNALKAMGNVVAVTGDGVNDAPALRAADIGVSMGVVGTDVAREASDMVLRDDNFATIVSAVEEGRKIFDNVLNFIKYLLSSNFDEIIVVGFAAIAGLPLPFLPLQILWVNLVTDGFPALALGVDSAGSEVMKRKPRPVSKGVLSEVMPTLLPASLIASAVTLLAFWYGLGFAVDFSSFSPDVVTRARTLAFSATILFEMFFVFNCRSAGNSLLRGGLTSNKYLLGAVVLSLVLQAAVIYVPVLQSLFGTSALGLVDLAVLFALSSAGLLPFLGHAWRK
ncbi:MAG: calcium-translocating P-type ATPase, PMCA-type [Candidatus Diapherotrites archaeon]|nr:calcium-translocating P-type ATPase, PMCA-type [Candidatus Diapherotrites archaeon]